MTNAQLHGCAFEGWQCFHCGEIFTTFGGAQDHFGHTPDAKPGCLLKVEFGEERGLLMKLRDTEKQLAEVKAENERLKASQQFNNLTSAESERLYLMLEESGELIQSIGKILRHGYESRNPFIEKGPTNRESLERELAHVYVAAKMMFKANDISENSCNQHRDSKAGTISRWLHHQNDKFSKG